MVEKIDFRGRRGKGTRGDVIRGATTYLELERLKAKKGGRR